MGWCHHLFHTKRLSLSSHRGGRMQFDSLDFYKDHAQRYSHLSHEYTHSVYNAPLTQP